MKLKFISFVTVAVFSSILSPGQSLGDAVIIHLKSGSVIEGKLIRLSLDKTVIDPGNNMDQMILINADISKMRFDESDKIINYPIRDTIIGNQLKKDTSPKKKKSFFSFEILGGRTFSITTSAFEGFDETKILPGFVIGGAARYFIGQKLEFELLVSYTEMKIKENDDEMGSLTFVPVLLSYKMQYIPRKKSGMGFHMDLGGGIAFTKYNNGSALTKIENQEGVTIKVETNTPFVFDMGIGLDVFIIRQFAIGCDFRIQLSNVSTVWKFNGITEEISDKILASSFFMGLNVRYCLR